MPKKKTPPQFLCGRRTHSCRICKHRYPKSERDIWTCPDCGEHRACKQLVHIEGEACHYHGGKSLKGLASPKYEGKGYSKYIPKGLMQDHNDFLNDPQRLTVSHEVALARTVLLSELESWGKTSNQDTWGELGKLYRKITQNIVKGKDIGRLLGELGILIEQGAGQAEHLESIRKQTETVRRLVDTERQIYVDRGELVAKGAFILLMDKYTNLLFDVIDKVVSNAKERNKILAGISELWVDTFGGLSQIKD